MRDATGVTPLSESISAPIIKAYTAGGLGLVFVFIGTLLLLVALFFGQGIVGNLVGVIGAMIIIAVLYLFYVQDIMRLKNFNEKIGQNQEMIDNVQKAAIEMTELAYDLQALAFKHANEIALIITLFRDQIQSTSEVVNKYPMLSRIPLVTQLTGLENNRSIVRASDLSASIVQATTAAKQTIEDVRDALVKSDPILLAQYLDQIEKIDSQAKQLLNK